jgi:two-component system, sensor histidine kinase PdtaS
MVYLQAGIYVLLKSYKTRLNQIFFFLSLCFAIWSFGYIMVYSADSPMGAVFWDDIASIGFCLFPAFMVLFILHLCECNYNKKITTAVFLVMFGCGVFLLFVNFAGYWKPISVERGKYSWIFEHNPHNIFYIFFYIYIGVATFISFAALIRWRQRLKEKYEIDQFRFYFYPLILFFIIGVTTDLVMPALKITIIPNIAHITSLPWIAGITYAMVKYQLMGINANTIVANNVIKQLKEIVLFVNNQNRIIRSNLFTEKLLAGSSKNLDGTDVFAFFENKALLTNYLRKTVEKEQLGPMVMTMKDLSDNLIETNLYFMAIKDRFNDPQGYIIYGHDNRESINLQKEIIVREHAERNLRAISDVLETRVKERTTELTNSYKELQVKMTERMRVEEQIKNDIAEKEVLINEIHNRVKNNMNIIISLILANDKENLSAAASRKFKELARRVKSLLLIHHNLYLSISYSDVDFPSFIKSLTDELLIFYKRKGKVEIDYDVSDVFLDVDYAIPMGLIVNELISNALQHAFSDYYIRKHIDKKHMIHIKYAYENNHYEISISDNGKGLPRDFDISELTTNGLPLADILVKDQVSGNMEIFTSSDGTMFKIVFYASK